MNMAHPIQIVVNLPKGGAQIRAGTQEIRTVKIRSLDKENKSRTLLHGLEECQLTSY